MKYRTSTFSSYLLSISKFFMIDWFTKSQHSLSDFVFEQVQNDGGADGTGKSAQDILKDIVIQFARRNVAYSNNVFFSTGQIMLWKVLSFSFDQARPWFRFSTRTSSVAVLGLCLVAFTRATLVVRCRELEHKYPRGGSKFLFSNWPLNVTNYGVCISILFCFKLEVCFFGKHFVKI